MTVPLYPEIIYEGDLTPDAVGDEVDEKIENIHEATKGWGTEEVKLIKALADCSPQERAQVAAKYETVHGKSLKSVMKGECGIGDFGKVLQLLAVPSDEAECDILKRSGRGPGTNEITLYPVICGRTNQEIDLLKKKFFVLYDEDLGTYLNNELGGTFEQLIFHCLQGIEEEYDPDYHTEELVEEDVASFYKMGEGKFGTDEAGLFKLLCTRPPQHLKKVNQMYADKHDVTLFKVMDDELRGDCRDATIFLVGMKIKPYETVAKLIKKACEGLGTKELLLASTIIRYQACLKKVMAAYEDLYGQTLQQVIKKELNGNFEKLMLEFCNAAAE